MRMVADAMAASVHAGASKTLGDPEDGAVSFFANTPIVAGFFSFALAQSLKVFTTWYSSNLVVSSATYSHLPLIHAQTRSLFCCISSHFVFLLISNFIRLFARLFVDCITSKPVIGTQTPEVELSGSAS